MSQVATAPQTFTVAAASAVDYWDPSRVSSNIVLSNSNKTATSTSTPWSSVFGVTGQSAGSRYFELSIDSMSGRTQVGVGNASSTTDAYVGQNVNSWGALSTGNKYHNGSVGSSGIGSYVAGDIIMVFVDFSAGSLWFGKNGTWSGNPNAGTGAAFTGISDTLYAGFSTNNSTPNAGTLRMQDSEFSYTKPVGATSWSGA